MLRRSITALFGLLLCCAATSAQALLVGGFYQVQFSNSDPGLVVQTEDLLGNPYILDLEVGVAQEFDLFRIWTDETAINGDDTVTSTGSVEWAFIEPGGFASSQGATAGFSVFFNIFQGGRIDWINPTIVNFNNGAVMEIGLSNEQFNVGLFGLAPGREHGAVVRASLLLTDAGTTSTGGATSTEVGEPEAAALFGFGLVGLAVAARRRRT